MKKNPTQLVFHSATPGFYATIPAWAMYSKKAVTAKCYHSNRRKSIIVDLAELKSLVDQHKIWVSVDEETGNRYITSKSWTKYFG